MHRILIADDEPPARARLRREIQSRGDCKVVAESGDGASAVTDIVTHQPDILLLDIQMPELTGFDVLANLPATIPQPAVIFCTAYDEHALTAFEVAAVDYLLKPWPAARLHAALDRAIADLKSPDHNLALQALLGQLPNRPLRLTIRDAGILHVVNASDIHYVQADGNYLEIHLADRELLQRETLTSMEDRLVRQGFFRLGRSTLVNLQVVKAVHSVGSGKLEVEIHSGVRLSYSGSIRDLEKALSSRQ